MRAPWALLAVGLVEAVTIWETGVLQGNVEEVHKLPAPQDFFKDLLRNEGGPFQGVGKPVLFPGAAKQMPAYELWTDEYLKEKHGKTKMDQVETEKEETRTKMPHEDWNLAKFLDNYKKKPIYSTATTPKGLADEVFLLPSMNCGGFTTRLSATVLWFSSGSTKSVVHNDMHQNFHCIIAGTKKWMLWRPDSKIDTPKMGWIRGEKEAKKDPKFENAYGTYGGKIDVDNVDLEKFPGWKSIKWWNLTMKAGDCAYVPAKWFHYVEAPAERSITFHVWFSHGNKFDNRTCEAMDQKGYDYNQMMLRLSDCTWGWGDEELLGDKPSKCKVQKKYNKNYQNEKREEL